ncbi:MAG: hypothetical protein DMF86_09295 [Acidobacteria bacterium]|nr:MAG: hypothetical protein DMF86_09295 [Acidobacteriota bacterium]
MPDTRLKIAVFIDFDNIEIGVKSTLNAQFDIGIVLEALKERGEVVSKIAYGDWTRAGDYSRSLTQHAAKLVQRNLTPGGDKNGADINLALDALEMAFTHPHINAYVIVGGDSDFITLVEKLKQYDKQIFVVGGRAFTSGVMQRNCHEFIAYENLAGAGRRSERGRPSAQVAQAPIEQAFPLVRRALKVLSDREVSPQLGLLKSTLLQLDSTFSERTYGVGSFRDFAEKLARAGFVSLRESGRNVLVELNEHGHRAIAGDNGSPSTPPAQAASGRRAEPQHAQGEMRVADGIKEVRRLFQTAPNPPRWPMYVRQVKQFLRGVDPSFDERRFGFATLVDLLRASQREGLFRIERDRQGVMRVFGGNVMQQAAASAEQSQAEPAVAGMTDVDIVESISGPEPEVVDGDVVQEIEPTPPVVDVEAAPPDAEPPGGRKPSRRRRAGAGTPAPRPRKSASRPRRSRAAKEPAPEPGQA